MKQVLAVIATLLIVTAYVPYIKDILKGKTKPHVYTWFITGLITFIAFGLQLSDGAGWGSAPTFFAAIAGFIVFVLSLGCRKEVEITKSDTLFFLLALAATGLWLFADQPLLSTVIVSVVEILAFIPTVRKSWNSPDQETVFTYLVNTLRFTLSTVSVEHYSLITVLYPLTEALVDGSIALYLMLRNHTKISKDKLPAASKVL